MLISLLGSYIYFTKEQSELQYVGNNLEVKVVMPSKFHVELASEGIYYSWGKMQKDSIRYYKENGYFQIQCR